MQILYNRPYNQRLTEPMLKELEEKLKSPFGNDPVNTLWHAYELVDNLPHPDPLPKGEGELHAVSRKAGSARLADTRRTESPLLGGEGQGEGKRRTPRSAIHRFADLVSLVRFSLEQQPVLSPFADSVTERFNEWLMDKAKAGVKFSPEQLAWLNLIRDHIATSLSIEPDDLELAPFNQRGGLGKAHQLFGEQLPKLLDELNQALAA